MRILLYLTALLTLTGCYTFKGTSIPPGIRTFSVSSFGNRAPAAAPNYEQVFQEALKDKIRQESRLVYNEQEPDIIFEGYIADFNVTAVTPQPGETTQFSRLTVTVFIEYLDQQDEARNWNKRFSFFLDYPSTANLLDIQDALLADINVQLTEDIFNEAFTDW